MLLKNINMSKNAHLIRLAKLIATLGSARKMQPHASTSFDIQRKNFLSLESLTYIPKLNTMDQS